MKSYGSHICGGSIINEKQVICAAHCVEGQIASMDAVSIFNNMSVIRLEFLFGFLFEFLRIQLSWIPLPSIFFHHDFLYNSDGIFLSVGKSRLPQNSWIMIRIPEADSCQKSKNAFYFLVLKMRWATNYLKIMKRTVIWYIGI